MIECVVDEFYYRDATDMYSHYATPDMCVLNNYLLPHSTRSIMSMIVMRHYIKQQHQPTVFLPGKLSKHGSRDS